MRIDQLDFASRRNRWVHKNLFGSRMFKLLALKKPLKVQRLQRLIVGVQRTISQTKNGQRLITVWSDLTKKLPPEVNVTISFWWLQIPKNFSLHVGDIS